MYQFMRDLIACRDWYDRDSGCILSRDELCDIINFLMYVSFYCMFPLFLIVSCIVFHYSVLRVRFYNKINKRHKHGLQLYNLAFAIIVLHEWTVTDRCNSIFAICLVTDDPASWLCVCLFQHTRSSCKG